MDKLTQYCQYIQDIVMIKIVGAQGLRPNQPTVYTQTNQSFTPLSLHPKHRN